MSESSIIITPSILSANLGKLQEEINSIEEFADWLQIDVMDGHFVPNLSFGVPIINNIQTKLLIDVHLMVTNPADRIQEFLNSGAKNITFHAEAVTDTVTRKSLIKDISNAGATVGIALNPDTPLDEVYDIIESIDLLLIMSVNPGFGGQEFIEKVLEKVKTAHKNYPNLMIQMDGGVDDKTALKCIKAGANNLVSGSFIFKSNEREKAINSLRQQ